MSLVVQTFTSIVTIFNNIGNNLNKALGLLMERIDDRILQSFDGFESNENGVLDCVQNCYPFLYESNEKIKNHFWKIGALNKRFELSKSLTEKIQITSDICWYVSESCSIFLEMMEFSKYENTLCYQSWKPIERSLQSIYNQSKNQWLSLSERNEDSQNQYILNFMDPEFRVLYALIN